MNRHRRRFDQHALVKRQPGHVEEGRIRPDLEVLGIVAVEMNLVIGKEPVDTAMFTEIGTGGCVLAGAAMSAGNHAGDDLVADLDRHTGGIVGDILSEHLDGTGPLMTEHHRAESEGIALVFVAVSAADAAPLDLDQHLIIADRRNRKLFDFELAGSDQHRSLRHFRHDITSFSCSLGETATGLRSSAGNLLLIK